MNKIEPFGWQRVLLGLPWNLWLVLAGGVGGGKTYAILLRFVQYLATFGKDASIVVVTRGYRATSDFELTLREVFGAAFGDGFRWNAASHSGTVPSGGSIEIVQVESLADTLKLAGRNITYLHVEEAGHFPTDEIIRRLLPRLRAPKGIPTCFSLTANPGGRGHAWLMRKYVQRQPWTPFQDDDGHDWVLCPSTFRDNPHLDHNAYERNIRTGYGAGSGLYAAMAHGEWNKAVAGGMFADLLGENVLLDPSVWNPEWTGRCRAEQNGWSRARSEYWQPWKTWIALDHGSSAPAVCLLLAKSPSGGREGPDGRFYSANSIVVLDETGIWDRSDPAKGIGQTVDAVAERIKAMCSKWGVRPSGVADDACFAKHGSDSGTIGNEYRSHGVNVQEAGKGGRVSGWQILRQLLSNAGKPDVPGLYISRNCLYLLDEMSALPRDERNPEDADTKAPDHASDALRYGVVSQGGFESSWMRRPW